jgi:heme-degrading monooxygenase HmoA
MPFVRISWGKVDSGVWDQFEQQNRGVLSPDTPGLLARWVARDTKYPDNFYTLSIWRFVADIDAWLSSKEFAKLAQLDPYLVGGYSTSVCEVRFEEIEALIRSHGPQVRE